MASDEDEVEDARGQNDRAHRREIKEAERLDITVVLHDAGGQDVGRRADQRHVAAHQRGEGHRDQQLGGRHIDPPGHRDHRWEQDRHGADVVHEGRHHPDRHHDGDQDADVARPGDPQHEPGQHVGHTRPEQRPADDVYRPDCDHGRAGESGKGLLRGDKTRKRQADEDQHGDQVDAQPFADEQGDRDNEDGKDEDDFWGHGFSNDRVFDDIIPFRPLQT